MNPISHWATVDTIIIVLVIFKFGLCVYVMENIHNKLEARGKKGRKKKVILNNIFKHFKPASAYAQG